MTPSFLPLFAVNMFWHLPLLILLVSLVYSATRFDQWRPILRDTFRWCLRLVGFLASIAAVLYFLNLL
jgi:hypothetical protein